MVKYIEAIRIGNLETTGNCFNGKKAGKDF